MTYIKQGLVLQSCCCQLPTMGKTSWQERWLGEEDALGDLYGEFLEKAEEETARCRWV